MLCISACSAERPTQIVISVATDLVAPGEIDALAILAQQAGVKRRVLHDLSRDTLPATLALTAGNNVADPVVIAVELRKKGALVVGRRARASFQTGRTLLLRVELWRECVVTSRGARCQDLAPESLPDYDKNEALRPLADAAPPPDAGADQADRPPDFEADRSRPEDAAGDGLAGGSPDSLANDRGPVPDQVTPKDGNIEDGSIKDGSIKDGSIKDGSSKDGSIKVDGPPRCPAPRPPGGVGVVDFVVDDNGGDDTKGDGACIAYKTIGKALSMVTSSKQTIWVAQGRYSNEKFPLTISGSVNLLGSFNVPRNTAIVLPSGGGTSAIAISGSAQVTIRGFQIDTGAAPNAWAISAPIGKIILRDLDLYGDSGVQIGGRALGAHVSGCRFYSRRRGLLFDGTSTLQGVVEKSSFYGAQEGIRVAAGKVVVDTCFFRDASPSRPARSGLTLDGAAVAAEVVVKNSVFEKAKYGDAAIRCIRGSLVARGSTFKSTSGPVIAVGLLATANLGDTVTLGSNTFSTAGIVLIDSNSQADILAYGNMWPGGTPNCTTQIRTKTARVFYAAGKSCGP